MAARLLPYLDITESVSEPKRDDAQICTLDVTTLIIVIYYCNSRSTPTVQ